MSLSLRRPPSRHSPRSPCRCEQEQQRCRDLEARLASLEERERAARSQPLHRVSSLSSNLSLPTGFGGSHTSLKREMYATWAVGAAGGIPPLTRYDGSVAVGAAGGIPILTRYDVWKCGSAQFAGFWAEVAVAGPCLPARRGA